MALADGPQAHDEPSSTISDARLIGCRNDRGIEEGGALDRVLVGEVGSDEQPPGGGHDRPVQAIGHQRVVPLEELLESVVTAPEGDQRLLEHSDDFGLGEGEDPPHQEIGARRRVGADLLAGQVRLGNDPAGIAAQNVRRAPDHDWSYSSPSSASSSISMSDNKKDTVLSAP